MAKKVKKKAKRKTINRQTYFPPEVYEKYTRKCMKLNVSMNKKTLELINEFLNK